MSTVIQCSRHGACLSDKDRETLRCTKVSRGGCNRSECPAVPCCIDCTQGKVAELWTEVKR